MSAGDTATGAGHEKTQHSTGQMQYLITMTIAVPREPGRRECWQGLAGRSRPRPRQVPA